jgi:hypothetical protein
VCLFIRRGAADISSSAQQQQIRKRTCGCFYSIWLAGEEKRIIKRNEWPHKVNEIAHRLFSSLRAANENFFTGREIKIYDGARSIFRYLQKHRDGRQPKVVAEKESREEIWAIWLLSNAKLFMLLCFSWGVLVYCGIEERGKISLVEQSYALCLPGFPSPLTFGRWIEVKTKKNKEQKVF